MSTSSRRIQERGVGAAAGGGKIAAVPTGKISPATGKSVSTGKENPRPTSRLRSATQKPSIRPMARTDKSAAAAPAPAVEEPHSRWSTSSVPRGRSSSPSEFTRVLSDLRKNPSRVPVGPSQRKVNGVNLKGLNEKYCQKSDIEKRVSKDPAKNKEALGELVGGFQVKEKDKILFVNNESSYIKGSSNLEKKVSNDFKKNGKQLEELKGNFQENEIANSTESNGKKEQSLGSVMVKRSDIENSNEESSLQSKSCTAGVPSGLSTGESKMTNKDGNYAGIVRANVPNKYPSKLHEKLAFLEGKVKRIATDISRTKEILDMNNPDASKMILSDLQEKITGIERAMVHVTSDENGKIGLVKSREIQNRKEDKDVTDAKSLVKGLKAEDLEARLFPHHKLMRDRTLSKTIISRDSEVNVDNSIALNFPVYLRKEESLVGEGESKIQEMDSSTSSVAETSSLNALKVEADIDAMLIADENLDEFDDQEREPAMKFEEEVEENYKYKLNDIGCKTSTGGWFVSEGEAVLLAHDDSSCSYYDIANCEEKAEYKPPSGAVPNMWQDCWIIRAPSADGCSGRYVVAASAGNSIHTGFCSWDFYTKEVRAFHMDDEEATLVNTVLAPLSNNNMYQRNAMSTTMATENRQWWYSPCGPLITSAASCQRTVQIYDIRDGEKVMKWELQKPVMAMDYANPVQWRNRGKVVIVESDAVSLWDVSSLNSQALMSVSSSGRRITTLHVNNTDAEIGGGVRRRISSAEAEGNDGVFCTSDSINVLDFRSPSGIGLKIPKVGVSVQSAYSRGDSIFIGCSSLKSAVKKQYCSEIQQFSLRKQRIVSTFALPESNASSNYAALAQVWGNSNFVMGVCGLGLFVFDSFKEDGLMSLKSPINVKEAIGPDDMYYPSFDYSSSRVLLISKDRPAQWRYLL
ncbi:hypothetical protein ACP275_14G028300 [Erythranthe tilingii]